MTVTPRPLYRSGRLAKSIAKDVDPGWPFWLVTIQDPELLSKVVQDASTLLGYNVIPVPGKYWEPLQSMPYDSLAGHDGELRQLLNNPRSLYFCSDVSAISPKFLYWLAYHFCEVKETSETVTNAPRQNPIFVGGSIVGRISKESLSQLSHFSYRLCELNGITQPISVFEFTQHCRKILAKCIKTYSLSEMTRDLPHALARDVDVDKEGRVYRYSIGNDCSILHVISHDLNDQLDYGIESKGLFIPLGYRSVLRTFMEPGDDVETREFTLAEQLEYMGRILAKYGQHLFNATNIDALMKIHADQVTSAREWMLSQRVGRTSI